MIFDWYWKTNDTEIAFEDNNILRIFINILDDFLDLISYK